MKDYYKMNTSKERVIYGLSWFFLLVYTAFWLISSNIAKTAETFFLICFIFYMPFIDISNKRYRLYLYLITFFLAVQIYSHNQSLKIFPELKESHFQHGRHYLKLFLSVVVAYWLQGSVAKARALSFVAVTGFAISLLFRSSLDEWLLGLGGVRVGFDYVNIQHTAAFFGLSLIASLLWTVFNYTSKRYLLMVVSFILSVIFFAGITITQTRAVWLGLGFSLLAMAFIAIKNTLFKVNKLVVATIIIALPIVIGSKPIFEKRIALETNNITAFIKGEKEDLSLDSAGIRVYMWVYAISKIKEKPWAGWGAESRKVLLQDANLPSEIKGKFDHFHNSYLELIVAYGFIGFFIILLIGLQSIAGTIILLKKGYFYEGLGLLGAWMFFFIINFFESYIIFSTARFFFMIFGGISLSFYLYRDKLPCYNRR